MTVPAPAVIDHKQSGSVPAIPLRRWAAVIAAAIAIKKRMRQPISRRPCSSRASTRPTRTICTRPRAIATTASRSTCTDCQRHSATTAAHSAIAPPACARPVNTSPPILFWSSASMQNLLRGAERGQPARLHDHRPPREPFRLGAIVRDDEARHSPFPDDAENELLDAAN